ncbi:Vacuolar protein 8 [Hondaea fermentalgiana]|uniref:Vacuolar protein 8 n=1 Tax=Hondaea fermentalgiana TaxID=2315210 RepID=A0A2R5GP59_9STRA|nr:Vacuolar protein 8 [Hondaea fermentalgiana]|eukprot:GBG30413.1 Vacuolar protein 8 [Hondaea fermentalgiana]
MTDRTLKTSEVDVGQLVRVVVTSEDGSAKQAEQQRTGMVTLVHEGKADSEGSFAVDVEFDDPSKIALAPATKNNHVNMERLELERVPIEKLRRLEAWEHDEAVQDAEDAEKLVRRAQFLAGRLRDFRSARAQLVRVLRQLAAAPSAGSIAVVFDPNFNDRGILAATRVGMVATIEDDVVEMMGNDDDTEDFTASRNHVICVPNEAEEADRFATLAVTAAKYALQQTPEASAEAVCLCAVAIQILSSLKTNDGNFEGVVPEISSLSGRLVDALLLKTRAHIVQNKLTAAAVDVKAAIQRDPGHQQARQLVAIIKQRRVVAQKQDRALAKSISTWVRSIVTSLKQYSSFGQMAKYNCSCLMSHILPPNPGWRENVQACVEAGGLEALLALLQKHPKDLEMLRGATNGLGGLTTSPENAGKLAKAGGVEAALRAMLGMEDAADNIEADEVATAGSELLERMARFNPEAIIDAKGSIEAVLDGLQHTKSDRVKAACATVADRVGMSDRGHKALLDKGALEAIVSAIAPGVETTEEVLKPTFRLLERFAQDPAALAAMKEMGLVEALVLQLEAHSSNEGLLRSGGRLLAKVAGEDLEAAIERLRRGGLTEEAREFTTALLANLALSPENVERIIASDGVAVLISNFSQFSPKSQVAAARALGRLAHTSKEHATEIIAKGGVEVLVEAMRSEPDNEELVSSCTQAISNLATSGQDNAAAVDAKGGLRAVFDSLQQNPGFETNSQAALTMTSQLASIGFDVNKLVHMGAVESILTAMSANLNSADVQRSGFRSLTALMKAEGAASSKKGGIKSAALAIVSFKGGLSVLVNSLELHRSRDLVVVPAIETIATLVAMEKSAADRLSKSNAVESVVSAVFTQVLASALGSVQATGAISRVFETHVRQILAALVSKRDATGQVKAVSTETSGVVAGKQASAEQLETALMSVTIFAWEPSLAKQMGQASLGSTLVASLKTLSNNNSLPMQNQLMADFALAAASFTRAGSEHVAALDSAGLSRVLIDTVKKHAKAIESTICCMRGLRAFAFSTMLREKLAGEGVIEVGVGAMRANAELPNVSLAALDLFLTLSSSDNLCRDVAFKGATRQGIKMIQDNSSSEDFERPTERALMVMERVAGSGSGTDEIRSNLVKQGAVDATTRAMDSYPWSEVIESIGSRLLSRLLDAGSIEAEIDKMEHLVGELQKASRPDTVLPKLARSMATVGALALSPNNTAVMIRKNAAGIVIEALHTIAGLALTKEREFARRAGFRALGQIAASCGPLDASLGAEGLIVDALSASVSKVTLIEKIGALNCIKSMATVEPTANSLVRAGVVDLIVKLIHENSNDEALVTAAFGALSSLAQHRSGADKCTRLGVNALVLKLMRNFQDSCSPRFSEEGFMLLANLALVDSNIHEQLEGGIIDLVTATLDQHCDDPASPEPRVLTAAVSVLQRLCVSEATIRSIVRKGAISKIIKIASSSTVYQSDPECMEAVIFLIETCAMVKETHETLAKAGAVDLIMSAMHQNATNENVAVVGAKALQSLLGASSDTVRVLVQDINRLAAQLKKKPTDRDTQMALNAALRNLANLTLVEGVVTPKAAGDISKTAVDTMEIVQSSMAPGPARTELMSAAIQMLGRTALVPGASSKIDAERAVKKLLAIIKANQDDDDVLEAAMFALGNLAATNPAAVRALGALGGIALLEQTMNESAENEHLREAAARALAKIRGAAASGAGALSRDGAGASALTEILVAERNDPAAMQDYLAEIGSGRTGARDLMAMLGASSFLSAPANVRGAMLQALQDRIDAGDSLQAISAAEMSGLLAGLETHSTETLDVLAAMDPSSSAAPFVSAGGVEKLLAIVREQTGKDPDAVRRAIQALNRLAAENKAGVSKLIECDAAGAVTAAMKAHPDDEALVKESVDLLSKLAAARGVAKVGMTAETMRLLNRALDDYGADRALHRDASKLVDGLSGIYKEESVDMVGARLDAALLAMGGASHIKELYDENGKPYYHNVKTGETTWDPPEEYLDARGAMAAASKLSDSHKDNVQEVDPAVLRGAVARFNEHTEEPARLTDLASALGVLATNETNRQEIAQAGGLEAIIAALNGDNVDPEFLAAALHLLNQFARNDFFKQQIAELGGIEAIILIMLKFIEHVIVVEKCAALLANLCYQCAENVDQVMHYNGVSAVSQAMARYPKESLLLYSSMVLLSNLMFGNDENKLVIGREVGLQVIQVVRTHFKDAKLFKAALRAIGNMTFLDENILLVVTNGATKCIVAGMSANEDNLELQQLSIEVIGNLGSYSEDDPKQRGRIQRGEQTSVYDIILVEGGAKRILETIAHSEEASLMMSGLEALSNLSSSPVVVDKLVNMGIVPVVFEAMSKYDWDEDLVEKAMRLVAILTYSSDAIKVIEESDGVQVILAAMEAHEDQAEFLANGAAALKNLAAVESLREEIGKLGGVPTILSLWEKNMRSLTFLQEATTLFIRLSRSEKISEEITTKGMNLILEALEVYKDDVSFLVPAFTLIGHLAFAPANLTPIIQYGGVTVLIDSILEHPESKALVIRGIQSLDNLASTSAEHSKIVIEAGGQETIKEVAAAYSNDPEVVQVCKSALLSMQPTVERRRARPRYAFGDRNEEFRPSGEDPLKEYRNMLKTGAVFTEWSNGSPQTRHLLVKPDWKSIAWKDPKKGARSETSLYLRDIRHVRSGLHDGHKHRRRQANDKCAFSIVARATSLDLEAKSEEDRRRWVAALSALINTYRNEPQWLR